MVQTMKFLIVEPSPLPILIPLGLKYSLQDHVSHCAVQKLNERHAATAQRGPGPANGLMASLMQDHPVLASLDRDGVTGTASLQICAV